MKVRPRVQISNVNQFIYASDAPRFATAYGGLTDRVTGARAPDSADRRYRAGLRRPGGVLQRQPTRHPVVGGHGSRRSCGGRRYLRIRAGIGA